MSAYLFPVYGRPISGAGPARLVPDPPDVRPVVAENGARGLHTRGQAPVLICRSNF
jgi:hypothetical protein